MCGAKCRYLGPFTGLKQLEIIGKDFADYGDGRTGIQERFH